MLKVGDEVYLSDKGIERWGRWLDSTPACTKGVVDLIAPFDVDAVDVVVAFCVEWGNGQRDCYAEEDLIKVTQEKPVVIGYKQIGHKGFKWDDDEFQLMSEKEMKVESEFDLNLGFAKAKFRPVYEVKK